LDHIDAFSKKQSMCEKFAGRLEITIIVWKNDEAKLKPPNQEIPVSLEQLLAENTAALREMASVTKELIALRSDAIEKVGAAAAATSTTRKKTDTKTDAGTGANISTSPEDRRDPADSSNPYDGVKELIAAYIGGSPREEERTARKEKMKALLNHEKIKKAGVETAKNVDDIMESAIDLFKSQVAKLTEKGDITTPAKAADDLDL